jgi:multidrug efflux pump subunit AcrA (membrane-fusion protein)
MKQMFFTYRCTATMNLAMVLCGGLSIMLRTPLNAAGADSVDVVKASGTLEPIAVVDVAPGVSGIIEKFGFDPNDKSKTVDFGTQVKKGTVLVQLDTSSYQLKLDQAKASVQKAEAGVQLANAKIALAEVELRQANRRVSDKTVDELELERAQVAADVAKAELAEKTAEIVLAKCSLQQSELNRR